MERRDFLKAAAAATAASYARVSGANDRIRVGLIGSGLQGTFVLRQFLTQADVEPVAIADVYQSNLEKGLAMTSGKATGDTDFRRLLERKDIDALIVGTPDHWHALVTIMACQAGKDVYCEKPLALTIREGQAMVNAARKYNRVVQTGSPLRSGAHYAQAVEVVRSGKLGKVAQISGALIRNVSPGFGRYPDSDPPPGLDWNMWLGPAPYRPYNQLRCLYNFRWFWDYSGGQMTNFGAHDLDIARWALNARGPMAVAGFGARLALDDGGETPDVQEVVFRFPQCIVKWSVREMNAADAFSLKFYGNKGTLEVTRGGGFKITGEQWGEKNKKVTQMEDSSAPADSQMSVNHVRNFLDCVKSRMRPNEDVEEGHLTATMCHLGNIATRLGRTLQWDVEKEEVVGDKEANGWLSRPYREPWKLA